MILPCGTLLHCTVLHYCIVLYITLVYLVHCIVQYSHYHLIEVILTDSLAPTGRLCRLNFGELFINSSHLSSVGSAVLVLGNLVVPDLIGELAGHPYIIHNMINIVRVSVG